jgi:hypothetical protein
MLRLARSFAQRDNVILAPLELSLAFIELVSRRLGFRPGALRRLNANEPGLPGMATNWPCGTEKVTELPPVRSSSRAESG